MNKSKVGIFPGSFNPIHVGHLVLANYMREFTYLDEVWFVVSPQNPLKKVGSLIDDDIRLHMTQLALTDFENLSVSDIEFSLPRPSYTFNTLEKLSAIYPEKEFTLLIGSDNWTTFHKWKDNKLLLEKYSIIIYPRLGDNVTLSESTPQSVQLVDAPVIEISSTFIRESIKNGKNIRAFLPAKVYDFIQENGLYKEKRKNV